MIRQALAALALILAGCASPDPRESRTEHVVRVLTPETMSVGLTAPNLFNGPIYNTPPKGTHRPDESRFGVVGGTISFTYRFKSLRIERMQAQPVVVVQPSPTPAPAAPHGNQ